MMLKKNDDYVYTIIINDITFLDYKKGYSSVGL